ncbi:CinA family protein [Desulfovulcanus sp.]
MEKEDKIQVLAELLIQRKWMLATAESCTGGLLGHTLTNIPGSSNWYVGGVITYANEMKISILGVDGLVIEKYGAVSEECVLQMVRGVCKLTRSQVGVAISGIAGPGGGTKDKPVGTVFMAWQVGNKNWAKMFNFSGDRQKVKVQSVQQAIDGLVNGLMG